MAVKLDGSSGKAILSQVKSSNWGGVSGGSSGGGSKGGSSGGGSKVSSAVPKVNTQALNVPSTNTGSKVTPSKLSLSVKDSVKSKLEKSEASLQITSVAKPIT